MSGIPRSRWITRYAALVGLWSAAVLMAVNDYRHDPYDPSLTGTRAYGHNGEGILGTVIPMMIAELAVALAILRPRTYHRSWGRAGAASVLLGAWGLMSLMVAMHAGGVTIIHGLWVLALAFGCLLVALWSFFTRRN